MVVKGQLDLDQGPMELGISGSFDPAELATFGAEDLHGRGALDVVLTGDILADDAP